MTTILDSLKHYYGYDTFRPGQQELIEAILSGKDALGIMPTGGGKSVCYQIPAVTQKGMTLVISPLISLMKDQVDTLQTMGIRAAYINSQLSYPEQQAIFAEANAGLLDLLYVSPERLGNDSFKWQAQHWHLNLIAVDEAHCVSQWGHDFRPSYQAIPQFIEALPVRPSVAGFTATATERVRADIIFQLRLQDPLQHIASFDRPNLYFAVKKPRKKMDELFRVVDKEEATIIYCNTRKNVEKVYAALNKKRYPVTHYHAGISAQERTKNQDDFLFDRKPIMVATNAFGMGIDKSNVRKVVHFNMPLDLESYYQEAGRAGRDGAPAEAVLFYSAQDILTSKLLIEQGNSPHAQKNLNAMILYCKTGSCLRKTLLKYFNETVEWNECENCSTCDGESVTVDITVPSQKILSCIYRMNQLYGTGLVTDVLRGKNTKRIKQLGFDELSTHGILTDQSDNEIKDMISIMVSEDYLSLGSEQYPILQFTEKTPDLLHAKISLSMQKSLEVNKSTHSKTIETIEKVDNQLFEQLRQLRTKFATEMGKPPFIVFTDKSLLDMAAKFPVSEAEFLDINGVGAAKLEAYGAEFLHLIQAYVAENELDTQALRSENVSVETVTQERPATGFSGDTVLETVSLFEGGATLEEIAKQRGYTATTISNHLAKALERGETLDYQRLVPPEVESEILAAIETEGAEFLKPIKEAVDSTITYEQIKFVLAKPSGKSRFETNPDTASN
ncbi:DNA helicase RecQ [Lacticigenium naphthae]|uniref:DNA helicase RecQ n=1 Tax=Lacticigenium naphthae TaxID=515351 RepID=UPI00041733D7|nr:DNA helicase RecQ [Lacticigenium naphthae]